VRFSLKWILAGMLYVAIAAAAFGTGKWHFADLLWTMTLFAAVYAIALAVFASGKRRAMAATFVVGCACFLFCVTFGGDAVPTARLLVASGIGQIDQVFPDVWAGFPRVPNCLPRLQWQQYLAAPCDVAGQARSSNR
jgi:hypothetical protein